MRSNIILSLFLIATTFIGVFGALWVMNAHAGHATCPLSFMFKNGCSSLGEMILATHHLSSLRQMSLADIAGPSLAMALVFAIIALLMVLRDRMNDILDLLLSRSASSFCGGLEMSFNVVADPLFKWCALHNKYELSANKGYVVS